MALGNDPKRAGKPDTGLGLDIGNHSVKIVEVQKAEAGVKLLVAGIKKITGYSREAISESIRSLAEELGVSSRTAAVSVSGPSVIVRFITMPKMSNEELKSAIRFEAEKFIPFNINECVIDYLQTGEHKDNKTSVILTAAKKEQIEDKIALAETAGFSVRTVDVDSFTVANSFFRNKAGQESDKTVALLNIGSRYTILSVIKGHAIYLARDITIGSKDFDAAISKDMNIDMMAAEEMKITPKEKTDRLMATVKGVFNALSDEIKLPFSYYENQYGRGIDEIYLSGGGARFMGLNDLFQESFGSQPIFWNPFGFVDTASADKYTTNMVSENSALFAVSLGLALR